jgi:hypothetical protein
MREPLADVLHKNLRFDLGPDARGLVAAVGQRLAHPEGDSPFAPMIARIKVGRGAFQGARGFFEAGNVFEERGELPRALVCYENAIFLERIERERLHRRALLRIGAVARSLGDPTYLAYLEEVTMPDADAAAAEEPVDSDDDL